MNEKETRYACAFVRKHKDELDRRKNWVIMEEIYKGVVKNMGFLAQIGRHSITFQGGDSEF